MNTLISYLVQFILGGGIIVAMTYLAEHQGAKYAALLYAVPIQFTLAAGFIYLGTEKSTIQELSISSIYSLMILIVFIFVFYQLTKKCSFWLSLFLAYILFGIGSVVYLKKYAPQM